MARYGTEHKSATRRRILDAAGRRLKADGIVASGVTALMADADLTNGAFYAHFSSKDDLVAAVIADQLLGQREQLLALAADPEALPRFVRSYLSPEHRDAPGDGCPSAALLEEVGRSAPPVRAAYSSGLVAIADDIAALIPSLDRTVALQALGTLFGTLQLARALDDRDLSDQVLARGIDDVLALLAGR